MKVQFKFLFLGIVLIHSLVIAQADALTILPNGDVGIGTNNPSEKLEVKGDVFVNGSNLWIGGNNDQKTEGLRLHHNGKSTYIDWTSGHLNLRNGTSSRMTIQENGNIGIGVDTPLDKLHIQNGNVSMRSNQKEYGTLKFGTSNTIYKDYWAGVASYNTGGEDQADLRFYTSYGGNKGERMRINEFGNLGVGVINPDQARLVVGAKNESYTLKKYAYFKYQGGEAKSGVWSNGSAGYSIYAYDRIASSEFNAFSDERIKTILGKSNASEDLETLSRIEVTNYKKIDTIREGNKVYKKAIAQQLKHIYPEAVSSNVTEVIPDIYQLSIIKDGWIPIAAKDLVAGDKIKLIFSNQETRVTVLEVKDNALKVASDKEGEVFVYGKQVDDFHTVDYEAISMLNVSATQALLQRIEQLESEKEHLKTELETYKEDTNKRLSDIEKHLSVNKEENQ